MELKMKDENKLYSIGQASKMANVSTRTLRHYESLGLIEPDLVKENGYRYYSEKTIIVMSIIKYLQFMDLSLDQIKEFIFKGNYRDINESFNELIEKTRLDIENLEERLTIINDWNNLVTEASSAFVLGNNTVSIKYLEEEKLIKYPMSFDFSYSSTILDLGYANFVKKQDNKITGAVMFYYDSYIDRFKCQKANIPIDILYIQKTVKEIENKDHEFRIRPGFYASVYHFGSYDNIEKSYNKISAWCKKHSYKLGKSAIERFVVDSWTFREKEQYVTEILIPIEMKVK